jgi:hypothetical protein
MAAFADPFHPQRYQGEGKRGPYFEGWYFRMVSPQGRTFALIPGVSRVPGPGGERAFIQFADSAGPRTACFSFSAGSFAASRREMLLAVGENVFTADALRLRLQGGTEVEGEVRFLEAVRYPRSPLHPGIMGPFSFLPGMECRHDVVTVFARLSGFLRVAGETVALDGGTGYIEKDWGGAFPSDYVWVQACGLDAGARPVSLMLSAARVPLFSGSVRGLIALLYYRGRLLRFATYGGARLSAASARDGLLRLTAVSPRRLLRVEARMPPGSAGTLRAPAADGMSRRIAECTAGSLRAELCAKDGRTVFAWESDRAAAEVCGDIRTLC